MFPLCLLSEVKWHLLPVYYMKQMQDKETPEHV